jgi:hypothetical protein
MKRIRIFEAMTEPKFDRTKPIDLVAHTNACFERVEKLPAVKKTYEILEAHPEGYFRTMPRTASKQALLDEMARLRVERATEEAAKKEEPKG